MRSILLAVLVLSASSGVHAGAPTAASGNTCTRLRPNFALAVSSPQLSMIATHRVPLVTGGPTELLLIDAHDLDPQFQTPRMLSIYRTIVPGDGMIGTELLLQLPSAIDTVQPQFAFGDLNGDGLTDVAVLRSSYSDTYHTVLSLFRGTSAGPFTPLFTVDEVSPLSRVVLPDLNGDGRQELVLIDCSEATAYRVEDDRLVAISTAPSSSMASPVVGDFDRDGAQDIAAIELSERHSVSFLFGEVGHEVVPFQRSIRVQVPFETTAPLAAIEADGQPGAELLLASELELQHEATLHAQRYDPLTTTLEPLWDAPLVQGAERWEPSDLNRDGIDDIILTFDTVDLNSSGGGRFGCDPIVHQGEGTQLLIGQPGNLPPRQSPRSQGTSRFVAHRDVDGDGGLDAVLWPAAGGGLTWTALRDDFSLVEASSFNEHGGLRYGQLLAADLNHDEHLDVVLLERYGIAGYSQSLIARDDGGFDTFDGPFVNGGYLTSYLHDIDGDGTVDLIGGIDDTATPLRFVDVAYGTQRGDFAPLQRRFTDAQYQFFAFGDLDGDGDDDMLANAYWDSRNRETQSVVTVEDRLWSFGPPALRHRGPLFLVYLDADKLADPVYDEVVDVASGEHSILWQRTLPGLRFAPPQPLVRWDRSLGSLTDVRLIDLDAAEPPELFLVFGQDETRTIWTLHHEPDGSWRTLMRETLHVPPSLLGDGIPPASHIKLADFDRDGLLDLVLEFGWVKVWRGDGSGRFTVDGPTWYLDHDPAFGDFDGDGWIDAAGRSDLGLARTIALAHNAPRADLSDRTAPMLSMALHPLPHDQKETPSFTNEWQVVTTLDDDCDGAPQLLSRQLDLIPISPTATTRFRSAAVEEAHVYRDPNSNAAWVVLLGANEAVARQRWEQALAANGLAIDRAPILTLLTLDQFGATPSAVGDGAIVPSRARLVQRYGFKGAQVTSLLASFPGSDITLSASAQDAAGRQSAVRRSLIQERARYCAEPQRLTVVCH